MLQRLWQHPRTLVQYVMTYSLGQQDAEVGQITLMEWSQIKDLCTLLHSFDMTTNMFSADNAIISMTIPVIHMLEHTLNTIRTQGLEQQEGEELQEDSYAQETTTSPRSRRSSSPRRQAWDHGGQGSTRAQGSRRNVEEGAGEHEEMEDELSMDMEDSADEGDLGQISVERGWGEMSEEKRTVSTSMPQTQRALGLHGCARIMSAFLLHYLQHDPRIVKIRSDDEYWLATLLDPRYKSKFCDIIPAIERDARMQEYQQKLLLDLNSAFPPNTRGARSESPSCNSTNMGRSRHLQQSTRTSSTVSGAGNSNFIVSFHNFFRPSFARPPETTSLTHSERLERIIQEYLQMNIDAMTLQMEPCSFWASNLEKWPELSTYALEILSCPAASVVSERVFSAAGCVLTDKRTRLSSDNVDRLTFIKMNKSWIHKEFTTPVSSWGE
ncbi:uncharacterized protein ACNLHF_025839 [Anomaloglossus baeobatrachus]